MAITHVFAGVPVVDRDAAVRWYRQLIGRAPDLIPNDEEAAWQLSDSGWIYVYAAPAGAGSALSTVLVDDLDDFLAGVAARGIAVGPVEAMSNGVRHTTVTDPDGNRLKVGQPPGSR